MNAVAVSAGESPASKTRALAEALLDAVGDAGVGPVGGRRHIDLSELGAEGLLGRVRDPAVDDAVRAASRADVLVLASPIYRATVSGPMKCFLDRFPTDGLRGVAVVLAASAAAPQHFLALDTGARALVASLGGMALPTVVFATSADFVDGAPGPALLELIDRAGAEASRF